MKTFPGIQIKTTGLIVAGLIFVAAIGALYLTVKFAESEMERDSLVWQNQMTVVIGGRETALEEWLDAQKKSLSRLAENPSLRLYLGSLKAEKGEGNLNNEALAHRDYLENQLKATALQQGYIREGAASDYRIAANVERPRVAGLALTSPEGLIMVSSPNMPGVTRAIAAYMAAGAASETLIVGPYKGESGLATLAFISPVFGVQDDAESPAIGFAVGIKALADDFYQKLVQPGDISRTGRTYLVRQRNGVVDYLSPLVGRNGQHHAPLSLSLDGKSSSLAAAFTIHNEKAFGEKNNFEGRKVWVTGRNIDGTDWFMLRTIASDEVMGAIRSRSRNIITISTLVVIILCVVIAMIWRHGISVRVAESAKQQRILAKKHEKISRFLKVVSDSQPTAISALDDQGRYTFANAEAARLAGISAQEMVGKAMTSLLDKNMAATAADNVDEVLKSARPLSGIEQEDHTNTTIKADYIPLHVEQEKGVLMVREDISELVEERQRRENALKNLISTLTMIIDSRDPYSAEHSKRVAQVSGIIAAEMGVSERVRETAEIAGAMMNLGKILVPREILTRPDGLSNDELETVRDSILKTANMLEGVDFDGPVVECLRQIQAHWDGSGSPTLAGEDILPSARIVAVANAFVGMTSARAHRPGTKLEKASMILLEEAGQIFDRKAVTALMNVLENKDGLSLWQHFGDPLPDLV